MDLEAVPDYRPPQAPSRDEERALGRLLDSAFLEGARHAPHDPPPPEWGAKPFGIVRGRDAQGLPDPQHGGVLAALLFPHDDPLGVVLFGHPGIAPAKGYFHRSDRIPFVRELGFVAVTFDHGGFGESDDATGLFHREWQDVLQWARRRFPDLPLHVWGVSVGGYFAHHALAQDAGIQSAVFEDVTPDLLRYGGSDRLLRDAQKEGISSRALQWSAAESHAPHVRAEHILYLHGEDDESVPPRDAERLWQAAGPFAAHRSVEGAAHLEAWKKGGERVREAVRRTLLA